MASFLEIARQLAPTLGLALKPSKVTFRAGAITPSGEHVEHGLVVRYGALDCVNNNARRLEDANFPIDGSIIAFGLHRIYLAVVNDSYPTKVQAIQYFIDGCRDDTLLKNMLMHREPSTLAQLMAVVDRRQDDYVEAVCHPGYWLIPVLVDAANKSIMYKLAAGRS
ncbi:hypothetical protein D1007_04457 [Hordeum vulgare]|nr:hypothetical protein D1007_04457 [Hordeum vulgare]